MYECVGKCIEKVLEEHIYQLFILITSKEESWIEKTEWKWKVVAFFPALRVSQWDYRHITPGNIFNDFKNGRGFIILNAQNVSNTVCFVELLIILDTKTFKNPQMNINTLEINK